MQGQNLQSLGQLAALAGAGRLGGALGSIGMAMHNPTPVNFTAAAVGVGNAAFGTMQQAGQNMAANKYGELLGQGAQTASVALMALGPAGMAAGAALSVVASGAKAFLAVVQSFIERGKQLEQYSGELSAASARSEVRERLADIREAQEIGPEITRLVDAQLQFDTDMREIWLPIKKAIVDVLGAVMEELADVMRDMKPILIGLSAVIAELIKVAADAMNLHIPTAVERLGQIPAKVGEAVAKATEPKGDEGGMAIQQLMQLAQNRGGAALNKNLGALQNALKQRLQDMQVAGRPAFDSVGGEF
jgi:hypothetical protein